MYAGRIVEQAPVGELFARPLHPYTRGLLGSIPDIDDRRERLHPIPGSPPDPSTLAVGCSFAPRCPMVHDRCLVERPELRELRGGHRSACHAAEALLPLAPSAPLSISLAANLAEATAAHGLQEVPG
jgi:oligopeptide/dipeptide ABC transporter ATP-binding protein